MLSEDAEYVKEKNPFFNIYLPGKCYFDAMRPITAVLTENFWMCLGPNVHSSVIGLISTLRIMMDIDTQLESKILFGANILVIC